MKRLLAYLFIVLGLGLTFSVSADDKVYCVSEDFKQMSEWQSSCQNSWNYKLEVDYSTYNKMERAAYKVATSLGSKRRHLFFDKLIPIREELYKEYLSKGPDVTSKK